MQYLSGAGSAMQQGKSTAGALDAITQQNIAGQSQGNMVQIFRDIISGKMKGGTMKSDAKGTTLSFDNETFSGLLGGESKMGAPGSDQVLDPSKYSLGNELNTGTVPTAPEGNASIGNQLNPSDSQPRITAHDVAGLSPTDISNALSGAVSIEGLKDKRVSDLVDTMYKSALIKESGARTGEILKGKPLDENFPIPHPEAGTLSLRQWKALPQSEKEYASYVHEAKKLGSDELSRHEFDMLDLTEKEKFLRSAMEDPELMGAAKDLATASATNINIGERTLERKSAESQAYLQGPKVVADIESQVDKNSRKYYTGEDAQRVAKQQNVPYAKAKSILRQAAVRQKMDAQLRQQFGDGVEYRVDEGWFLDGKLIRRDPYGAE